MPVGAVWSWPREVIGRGANAREATATPPLTPKWSPSGMPRPPGSWRLDDATLYVTLEPCPMCAGALVMARLGRLVFGAADPKAGSCGSLYNLCADPRLNHELPVSRGILGQEAAELLTTWFAAKRP